MGNFDVNRQIPARWTCAWDETIVEHSEICPICGNTWQASKAKWESKIKEFTGDDTPHPPGPSQEKRPQSKRPVLTILSIFIFFALICTSISVINSTYQSHMASSQTATAADVAATQKSATATAQASLMIVYGPTNGSLKHDTSEGLITSENAGVNLRDFVVQAKFFNPYAASVGPWDYGFVLRLKPLTITFVGSTPVPNVAQLRLSVSSNGSWNLVEFTGGDNFTDINSGVVTNLDLTASGSNLIKVVCKNNAGELYLNGHFVADLNLSSLMSSGDVSIVTGFYKGDEITGNITRYEGFTIWGFRNP